MLCFFNNSSFHEQYDNGWYTVKSNEEIFGCEYNNIWGYFEDGIEIKRRCYLLLVHRGWGDAPENSLESFKLVKENGYDGFETDVYFTKDNIPVLSHDETINRIARNKDFSKITESLYIKDLTLKDLDEYIFPVTRNGKVLKNYPSNKITTLEEALKYAKENKLYIAIELKAGNASQIKSLVRMVHQYKMNDNVRYISFVPQLLKNVQMVDRSAELHLLDKSKYTKTGTCEPDYMTRYCKSITKKGIDDGEIQRKIFHGLLDTEKNFVYITGEVLDNRGRGTSMVYNYPESIILADKK